MERGICFTPTASAPRTTPVTVCLPVTSAHPPINVTNVGNEGAVKQGTKA